MEKIIDGMDELRVLHHFGSSTLSDADMPFRARVS